MSTNTNTMKKVENLFGILRDVDTWHNTVEIVGDAIAALCSVDDVMCDGKVNKDISKVVKAASEAVEADTGTGITFIVFESKTEKPLEVFNRAFGEWLEMKKMPVAVYKNKIINPLCGYELMGVEEFVSWLEEKNKACDITLGSCTNHVLKNEWNQECKRTYKNFIFNF